MFVFHAGIISVVLSRVIARKRIPPAPDICKTPRKEIERRLTAIVETVYRLPVPLPVALLTDLHNHPFGAVGRSLAARRPELICLAGDVFFGGLPGRDAPLVLTQKHVLPFLRLCAGIAPTFLSIGNHELTLREPDIALIRETGVTLLDNAWARCRGVWVGGLTSHHALDYRLYREGKAELYPVRGKIAHLITEPETAWLEGFERLPGYKVLLSHHPEYYPKYLRGRDIDLILSGHAHGGQWRIGKQGIFAPGQGLFPKLTSGVHDGRLVISRGLSNTAAPVPRLNNPTEIVYIEPA